MWIPIIITLAVFLYAKKQTECFLSLKYFQFKNKSRFLLVIDNPWVDDDSLHLTNYLKKSLLHKFIIDIDDDNKFQSWFGDVIRDKIETIDIVIHSYGGSLVASDTIIKNLLDYTGTINIYVPYHAMSAGTRLMLVGDKIYMNSFSLASPMDPQVMMMDECVGQYSVKSLMKLVELKGIKKVKDATGLNYVEFKKLYDDNIRVLNLILHKKYKKKTINNIVQKLGYGNIPHHIPHSPEELKRIGIPVVTDVPADIMDLFELIGQ